MSVDTYFGSGSMVPIYGLNSSCDGFVLNHNAVHISYTHWHMENDIHDIDMCDEMHSLLMRVLYHLHNILVIGYPIRSIKHTIPLLKSYCLWDMRITPMFLTLVNTHLVLSM